jgi:ABC-type glycerol-3-phosphate transport system substrate-binding protein
MQHKSFAIISVFLLAALALAGCHSESTEQRPPSPYAGLTIRVACSGDPSAAVVSTASKAWQGRHQATVEVVCYDRTKGPSSVEADVWILEPAELPRWADAGALAPLPETYTTRENAYTWTALLPLYRDHLLAWGRNDSGTKVVWGLPLLGESLVLCYRTDLLRDGPPTTWEQLTQIAETHKDGPALPPLPADDEALEREFYTIASGYMRRALAENDPRRLGDEQHDHQVFSFQFNFKTGEPGISAPGFAHALGLMQRMQRCRAKAGEGPPERAFLEGRALFCLTSVPWIARFQGEPDSKVRGRFSVCPMPGAEVVFKNKGEGERGPVNRIPYLGSGGRLGVVPKSATNQEAAFDLLADLSGPRMSAQIVQEPRWGGGAIRADQLGDAMRWDSFELDRGRTAALKSALQQTLIHSNVKNPAICLRTPDQQDYRPALVAELRKALEMNSDPTEALERVKKNWQQLVEKRDKEKHRIEYRISLGLKPSG